MKPGYKSRLIFLYNGSRCLKGKREGRGTHCLPSRSPEPSRWSTWDHHSHSAPPAYDFSTTQQESSGRPGMGARGPTTEAAALVYTMSKLEKASASSTQPTAWRLGWTGAGLGVQGQGMTLFPVLEAMMGLSTIYNLPVSFWHLCYQLRSSGVGMQNFSGSYLGLPRNLISTDLGH